MSSKRHLFSFNATDLIQEPRTKLCITEYMPIALIALERTRVLAALGRSCGEGNGTPLQYSCLENPMDRGAWWAAVHGVTEGQTRLSDFTFTFHFHSLEKETATQSSVLAWRIPGTAGPSGLPSMGSHRVGHDWSDWTAAGRSWVEDQTIYFLYHSNLGVLVKFSEFSVKQGSMVIMHT